MAALVANGFIFAAAVVLGVATHECDQPHEKNQFIKCRMQKIVKQFRNGGSMLCPSFKIAGFGSKNGQTTLKQLSFNPSDNKEIKGTIISSTVLNGRNFEAAAVPGKAYAQEIRADSHIDVQTETTIIAGLFDNEKTAATTWMLEASEIVPTKVILAAANLKQTQPGAEKALSSGAEATLIKDFQAHAIDFNFKCLDGVLNQTA